MAISKAVSLANLSSGDALTVDSANDRVGVASTTPTEALTVVGVVSATSFFGDGTNLTGVSASTQLTIGVRVGSAVTFTLSGSSFNVINRAGGNIAIDL